MPTGMDTWVSKPAVTTATMAMPLRFRARRKFAAIRGTKTVMVRMRWLELILSAPIV